MKKFFKSAAILAFGFGVAMTFTACHSGSDDSSSSQGGYEVPEEQVTVENTLYVEVANAATVKYNGATQSNKSGNVYRFDNAAKTGNLVIMASKANLKNFDEKNPIKVNFGNATEKYINVELIAAATQTTTHNAGTSTTVSQAEGDEQVSEQNGSNTTDVVENANMVVPADAPSGEYSIVFYTPAAGDAATPENTNDSADEPVLAIDCEPSGTTFTTPVDLTTTIPGIYSLGVKLKNGNDEAALTYPQSNDIVKAAIPHFSSWLFVLTAQVTGIDNTVETTKLSTFSVNAGKNRKSYSRKLGYEASNADNSLVGRFVKALYGTKARTLTSSFSFTAPYAGVAEVTVAQSVRVYHFSSKNPVSGKATTFDVKMYGSAKPSVVVYPYTHSGGAN